ncbi:MAG: glycine cleavage system aminomethyltransferase GcvT, partial [Bosea sp. (in: a-proteobacteria)]
MPVQYRDGIMAEHLWTREKAGLFDVSHMGQAFLIGPDHETTARALEALIPADIVNLAPGKQRYSQLLNDEGGILDDLMVTRSPDAEEDGVLFLVVNAACKDADYAHIAARLPDGIKLITAPHRALIALQGPAAVDVVSAYEPSLAEMAFMTVRTARLNGIAVNISRSGYTGEDGFEISVANERAGALWDLLAADSRVKPIGLGARDSLRLEGGLCLYGHDIDATTSPIEGGLAWSIQKRRREEGGFPGSARIQRELAEGPARKRVGILPEGRQPAREGAEIAAEDGRIIGRVTSGGFGPSLNGPLAMGLVEAAFAAPGTALNLMVRGKPLAAKTVSMPFIPNRFKR